MIKDLNFVQPEQEGLCSEYVLKFIELMEWKKVNLHSFMIVHHGNILAEGYCKPFDENSVKRLYSASKTIVSLTIGKLVGENKIKLSDTFAAHFPEYVPKNASKWLLECTIEDALKMSVPAKGNTYGEKEYSDWVWTFFNHPTRSVCVKPSGSVFSYNTAATFMLCALIERLTGKTFLEYLRPEFDKIGVSKDIWCVQSPDGYAWGGSGVRATMRDFAKIGELLLHKGEYNGEQLLLRAYMEKATSKQISNIISGHFSDLKTKGYGYQIWINEKGYSMYGMCGQLACCFPDKDLMFVCNGDTAGETEDYIYDCVYKVLYENVRNETLPVNGRAYASLQAKLKSLDFISGLGEKHSDYEKEINGKTYYLQQNEMGWKWFRFDFVEETGTLTYENARGVKQIPFGCGKLLRGTFPETHYYDKKVFQASNREFDSLFIAEWTENKKLLLRSYIIDTNFANVFMSFGFKNNEVGCLFRARAEWCLEDYQGVAGGKAKE